MRPRRSIPLLLAAFTVAAPVSVTTAAGAAAEIQVQLPAPVVTSTDYPDDGMEHGGVGEYGDFTFADPSGQAVRYSVRLDGRHHLDLPTEGGAPVTVAIAPQRSGPLLLDVQSFGPAGESSPRTSYMPRVRAGSAPKAHWRLDESAGTRRFAAEARDGEDPITARAVGRITAGVEGQLGAAARLAGGHASARPQVDTTKSFTVTAWARPSADGDSVVIAATGRSGDAFSLQSRGGHWAFVKSASDSPRAATTQAVSEQPVHPDTWTHLAGSYDATQKRLRLYVNGSPASDVASGDGAWNAQGSLRIGAGVRPRPHAFRGDLDEVRVYDRIIVPAEAAKLPDLPKTTQGRWKFNTDGADDSGHGNDMTLRGGAVIDPGAGFQGWASPAGLRLDGAGAYAEAAGPVIRSGKSFTVAAWANTDRLSEGTSTLLSLPGEHIDRFALRYGPDRGWELVMADSDAADAKTTAATHSGSPYPDWQHIAVVYDAPTRTMGLYVNGWYEEGSSVKTGVGAFNAEGALQIGRSAIGDPQHWAGDVDDVWAVQGALTQEQISILGGGMEIDTVERFD